MNVNLWKQYAPSESQPWNVRRVIHLHRRAAFAATWQEIQRDLRDGPDKSIDRLLGGTAAESGVPNDFDALASRIGRTAVVSNRTERLKAWWLFRMIFTPDPLTERLALMWHNHFATSNHKVRNLNQMKQQNAVLRKYAKAEFAELLPRAVKSPAMLVWLDAQANHKEHPNENLARELMELFSLSVGNYSETDVKEAARALTGWTVSDGSFHIDESLHDDGEKTILGKSGRWTGDDLLRIVIEHPATARRIAFRLCEMLTGEGSIDLEAIDQLADGLRANRLSIAWAVETVLRSERFFSDGNIGNRPLAPVEFIVGVIRALEQFDPAPSTLLLAEWSSAMGQDLFHPPSVFGWPGGRAWLTTRTLIARSNFADAIVSGAAHSPKQPLTIAPLAARFGLSEPDDFAARLTTLLAGTSRRTISLPDALSNPSAEDNANGVLRRHVMALISSPDAQLG